jgi:large subunit ribosomal protein L29
MKPSEVRELSTAQIEASVKAAKKELMELRFQAAVGQLSNPHRVRELKKDVARMLTIATQQQTAASK